MDLLRRAWIPATPLLVWIVLLATKPRLWEPTPRMTSGNGPPFASIGTIAVAFGVILLAVAILHRSKLVAFASGLVGAGVALTFLFLALRV